MNYQLIKLNFCFGKEILYYFLGLKLGIFNQVHIINESFNMPLISVNSILDDILLKLNTYKV
jgi:hypothetical protein